MKRSKEARKVKWWKKKGKRMKKGPSKKKIPNRTERK